MKKVIFTLFAALTLGYSTFAAKTAKLSDDGDKVFYTVKNQFNAEFGSAENVTWTVNNQIQKAEFTEDGVKMAAYYNTTGQYIGFSKQITFNELPAAAKKELAATYKGFFADEVLRYEDTNVSPALQRYMSNDETYFVKLSKDNVQHIIKVTPSSSIEVIK
ncbi:hypothetical protein HH214_20530 [Mucilaginibacter robiniae]|uniref:Beta-lactamase-inhibitor-like PepSY-like domain-containing protein n=1 Tax=Mucilaginibacter robiniae TaxID=2728022 RepID=A0A7L5E440_9SPHI|nr:hypothetical protein [Mucilaginibacter robiniae]QJD98090.1 hypothetical protein HH214_20530 [Mucilaginibacter robiniae]